MKIKFCTLKDAIQLAEFAHRNQLDKAGMPYIEHPRRVLSAVQAQGARPYVQIAAILHDIVEDTNFSINTLIELGFPESSCILIELLTRNSKVSDAQYYKNISKNSDAKMIKLADIRDNTAEWRLSYLKEETQRRLKRKYAKAISMLK